ncbi:MAG: aminoacyl-tRNA hydrolase [Limnochordaceae bacterium]|nr:aminoacyl-tRNA hydrolase [Limnochordaceae bacterium]
MEQAGQLYVVAGLGNPGERYAATRHNLGFWVVDRLAEAGQFAGWRRERESLQNEGCLEARRVLLLKPLTFMNASGEAIAPVMARYRLPLDRLLVVCDDMDLPVGRIRLKAAGSSGGHRGLASIIAHLGTGFARLRVGIGRPDPRQMSVIDYVLAQMNPAEQEAFGQVTDRAATVVRLWLREGLTAAMNWGNPKEPPIVQSAGST